MLAQERQDRIYEQICLKRTVTVKELAQTLRVTEVTVRRDLEIMEKKHLLLRVHGGAKEMNHGSILSPNDETKMMDRLSIHFNEKNRVCQRAAELVQDGDCIFLDGGTSLLPILPYISNKRIRIVTNNVLIVHSFENEKAELIALGGTLIPEYKMIAGPIAFDTLDQFNFDLALIGCAGFDPQMGFVYTAELDTLAIKRKAIKLAQKKYLLTDSSKAHIKGFCSFRGTESFDSVICDDQLDAEDLKGNYIFV